MHVVTHLLAGWIVADQARLNQRDTEIVAWSCVIPDIDGVGMVVDAANNLLGRSGTTYYETYHHYLGHGLIAAIVATGVAYVFAIEKRKTAVLAFFAFHLHLLMDLAGSRGSNPMDIWPIDYLAPVSQAMSFAWDNQWPLTGWHNTTITILLMVFCLYIAPRRGRSPVSLFSNKADLHVVATLRSRFRIL